MASRPPFPLTPPGCRPIPATDAAFQFWLLLLLRFQPRPFFLGLVLSTLGLHPSRLRTSPGSSPIPPPAPKRPRPQPPRVLLTLPSGCGPVPALSFLPDSVQDQAQTLDPSLL